MTVPRFVFVVTTVFLGSMATLQVRAAVPPVPKVSSLITGPRIGKISATAPIECQVHGTARTFEQQGRQVSVTAGGAVPGITVPLIRSKYGLAALSLDLGRQSESVERLDWRRA